MVRPLPATFVRDPIDDLRREALPYVEMTPDERGALVAAACRGAAAILAARPDRAVALAHTDPVPESTEAHLARLRERARLGG